jgi:hypothetical protein
MKALVLACKNKVEAFSLFLRGIHMFMFVELIILVVLVVVVVIAMRPPRR